MECHLCSETRKLLLITAVSVLFLLVLPLPYMMQVAVGFCILLLLVFMAIPHLRDMKLSLPRKH